MEDQRQEPRTHLIYYLRVYQPDSNELFGHVVDISKHGMLITSDRPMQKDSKYRLSVEDASTLDDLNTIKVDLECRWCMEDPENALYDAGFRLMSPTSRLNDMLSSYQ